MILWYSQAGIAKLASPSLGPCKVRQLELTQQKGIRTLGIKSITPERFPGASRPRAGTMSSVLDACLLRSLRTLC